MKNRVIKIAELYKGLSVPVKASIWFVFCNFFVKGISFITSPLFAWFLPVTEYGGMSVFNSYEKVILIFATLELSSGAYQRGLLRYKDEKELFTQSTVLLSSLITLLLYFICIPFLGNICSLLEIDITIWNCLFFYLIVYPAYNCWLIEKRLDFKYRSAVIVTIMFSLFPTIGTLLSVVFISATAKTKICCNFVMLALCYLPFYIREFHPKSLLSKAKKVVKYWKYELTYQLPLVPHSLSYLVLEQADRIMINVMVGKTEVALYSVSSTISMAVTIFQSSVNQSFLPWCYHQLEKKNYTAIRKVSSSILVIIAGFILLCILVAPEIIRLFYPSDYMESIWVIPPIMLGVFFMFLYSIFVNIETYYEKTRYIMYVSVVCALINIILNYFVLMNFNYIWCGYTTLVSYIIFSLGHYYFHRKVCREKIDGIRIFDMRVFLGVSIALCAIVAVITFFYENWILRYLFALIIALIAIFNRKKIIQMINSIRR